MLTTYPNGMDRRRSRRIPVSLPLDILGLEPALMLHEHCNTVEVSHPGCQFIAPIPFKRNARLRLTVLSNNHSVTARVVRSIPVWPEVQVKRWKVGTEFDSPGNDWGVDALSPDREVLG